MNACLQTVYTTYGNKTVTVDEAVAAHKRACESRLRKKKKKTGGY